MTRQAEPGIGTIPGENTAASSTHFSQPCPPGMFGPQCWRGQLGSTAQDMQSNCQLRGP